MFACKICRDYHDRNNGEENVPLTEVSTENNLLTSVDVVKILADRCLYLQIHLRMSEMMF
jgi:hypothetical protein